jgi:hypothetical protein
MAGRMLLEGVQRVVATLLSRPSRFKAGW